MNSYKIQYKIKKNSALYFTIIVKAENKTEAKKEFFKNHKNAIILKLYKTVSTFENTIDIIGQNIFTDRNIFKKAEKQYLNSLI